MWIWKINKITWTQRRLNVEWGAWDYEIEIWDWKTFDLNNCASIEYTVIFCILYSFILYVIILYNIYIYTIYIYNITYIIYYIYYNIYIYMCVCVYIYSAIKVILTNIM